MLTVRGVRESSGRNKVDEGEGGKREGCVSQVGAALWVTARGGRRGEFWNGEGGYVHTFSKSNHFGAHHVFHSFP